MANTYTKAGDKGYYTGYNTTVIIQTDKGEFKISTHQSFQVLYEVNSDMTSTPASNTVTLYNISKSHLANFKLNDHISVYTGPSSAFGMLSEGYITRVEPDVLDGRDRATTITFTEAVDTSKNTNLYSAFNGSKTVKEKVKLSNGSYYTYSKREVKKMNIAFRKGTKASTIIKRICRDAKINLDTLELKKDHVYKSGYTLSAKALTALSSLAKDCGSVMYQRRGKVVIETGEKPNPYHDNLYFGISTGLTSVPTYEAESKGTGTWTFTCFENPNCMAGSAVYVKYEDVVNKLMRVDSVVHTHDADTYTMEVKCSDA